MYRKFMNYEVIDIKKGEGIVKTIKANRLPWYDHIKRIEGNKNLR